MTDPRSRVLVALRVSAPPEVAFDVFTDQIGQWWQPSALFPFTSNGPGRLRLDGGPSGRLVEVDAHGDDFEIGRVLHWEPPHHLALSWRQASFAADQQTEVHVRFEAVDGGTRVTVEHFGWDTIPREHAARHGFPLGAFQLRHAEWWQALLWSFARRVAGA
ncbi:MAG: SRPBCC domain-containing protein [Acidimicrobiia bacterium]|nr:SRPBCC domain-containing protein [Acidimicrobiia bacterium]